MPAQLELFYPRLLRETYVIHRTGGSHPFKHVKEASSIYHQDIWPYIERIHWPDTTDRANHWRQTHPSKQMNLNISFQHVYPYISLMGMETVLKYPKDKKPCWTNTSVYVQMHVAVARAFVTNIHNKGQVCHVNDDPADYRVENLRWVTPSENSIGYPQHMRQTRQQIYLRQKEAGWID